MPLKNLPLAVQHLACCPPSFAMRQAILVLLLLQPYLPLAPLPTLSSCSSRVTLLTHSPSTPDLLPVCGLSIPDHPSPPRPPGLLDSHTAFSCCPSDDSLMSTSQAGSTLGFVTNDLHGSILQCQVIGSASLHYPPSISSCVTTHSAKLPSSFHLRLYTASINTSCTHEHNEDNNHPKSSTKLCSEIESIESKGCKLLDASNGLKLTALTKPCVMGPMRVPLDENLTCRLSIYPEPMSSLTLGSPFTLISKRAVLV